MMVHFMVRAPREGTLWVLADSWRTISTSSGPGFSEDNLGTRWTRSRALSTTTGIFFLTHRLEMFSSTIYFFPWISDWGRRMGSCAGTTMTVGGYITAWPATSRRLTLHQMYGQNLVLVLELCFKAKKNPSLSSPAVVLVSGCRTRSRRLCLSRGNCLGQQLGIQVSIRWQRHASQGNDNKYRHLFRIQAICEIWTCLDWLLDWDITGKL